MATISLILCTKNRADLLPEAVRSIEQASAKVTGAVELLIVNNGSTDRTAEVLKTILSETSVSVRSFIEERPGLSRAKNLAIAHAIGDIIAFTDDDCRLHPDYFIDLLRHYSADAGPVVRGGRVELGDENDLPFTIKLEDKASIYAFPVHPGGFAPGCNLTMAREVIDLIGGFDEEFGPGGPFVAAEDTDLVFRAYKAGITVCYVPDMITYHFHGRRAHADIFSLNRNYQIGNGALHVKHGITDPILGRHLYWNLCNYVREFTGGPIFDKQLRLSHSAILSPSFLGMVKYAIHRLKSCFTATLG